MQKNYINSADNSEFYRRTKFISSKMYGVHFINVIMKPRHLKYIVNIDAVEFEYYKTKPTLKNSKSVQSDDNYVMH